MSEFVDFLHEVFAEFGSIRHRKMFGGYGIYHQDLMFGLVADDELYLKVDIESEPKFTQHDLPAFEYHKGGKPFKMSYRLAPEAIYDDPQEAAEWAHLAFEAAVRAATKSGKKPKSSRHTAQSD